MAPEQATRHNYGKKVDIYSAGIILYQLIVGKHPFHKKGDSEKQYIDKLSRAGDLELPEDLEVSSLF